MNDGDGAGPSTARDQGTRAHVLTTNDRLAHRRARVILAVVMGAICIVGALNAVAENVHPLEAIIGLIVPVTLLLMLFLFFSVRMDFPSRAGYVALGVEVLLVYLPFPIFGQAWVGVPGFLAGSVLLALPERLAWWGYGGVLTSVAVIQGLLDGSPTSILYTTISTAITGLVTYALSRLGTLVRQLQAAREELARTAVAEERVRLARDLHDLLGYSLSAVTLKGELVRSAIATVDEPVLREADTELDEMLALSRRALADVRAVARGHRPVSLRLEIGSIETVLDAAGIHHDIDITDATIPPQVDTVLAIVLREGITNILRHSHATRCSIRVEADDELVTALLRNDGVVDRGEPAPGRGVVNLQARLDALGGSVVAKPVGADEFQLRAVVPLRRPVAAPVP